MKLHLRWVNDDTWVVEDADGEMLVTVTTGQVNAGQLQALAAAGARR